MNQTATDLEKINFDFEALEACPVCGGRVLIPNGKINWLETDFWYVVCPACGLKFMNPRPTMESYRSFYKDKFWQQKVRNMGYHKSGQAWQRGRYKWDNEERWDPEFGRKNISDKHRALRVETIVKCLGEHLDLNQETKILEVGCGFPVTLEALKEKFNCRLYAIEPSEETGQFIKQSGQIDLIGLYAEELAVISQGEIKFDAIIFSHVLENTTDPLAVFQSAAACLAPRGAIYLQTPNLLVNDQMNPYHPFIFCRQSMRLIVEKSGLRYEQKSALIDRMLTIMALR